MVQICAWCGEGLGGGDDGRGEVSHGICPACRKFFMRNVSDITMGEFLGRMSFPVLVVDDDVRAVDGNEAALRLVGKDKSEVLGYLGGDLLECAYARLPGGCGKTDHCRGCAVRKAVTHTHSTGEPQIDVPCYLHTMTPGGEKWTRFLLSTMRLKSMVLMKIRDVGEFIPPEEHLKRGA